MMPRIIWGEKADYYTQRNNKNSPGRACGVTSIVNALVALGYDLPKGEGQPEDRLFEFINADPECLALYKTKPHKDPTPPNEWQDVLALGTCRWMGKQIAAFSETASLQAMFDHILRGGACAVTGEFPAAASKVLHHTVALIGMEFEGSPLVGNVTSWFIRDPWGDHRTQYRTIKGELVELTPAEAHDILKAVKTDRKWCIYISKKE